MKLKYPKIVLVSSIGLIVFGFNNLFNFVEFENPKTNSIILFILAIVNMIGLYKKANEDLKK